MVLNNTYDDRGAKFLHVPILVLLIALLSPFMCFLTFFDCSLSSSTTLLHLEGCFGLCMFSFVALCTLKG